MRVSVVAVRRPVKDHLASIYQLYIIIPRITALIAPVVFTGDDLAVWMTLREGEGRSDLALASFLVGHYGAASIFKPSSSVFLSTFFLFFFSFPSTILFVYYSEYVWYWKRKYDFSVEPYGTSNTPSIP